MVDIYNTHDFYFFCISYLVMVYFIFCLYRTFLAWFIIIGELLFFHTVGREWEALHLYIAHNLDWMDAWIQICTQHYGRLSWEGCLRWLKELIFINILILRRGKLT